MFIEHSANIKKSSHEDFQTFSPLTNETDANTCNDEDNINNNSSDSIDEEISYYSTVSEEQSEESDNEQQTVKLRRLSQVPVPKSYKDYYLYSAQSNFFDPTTVKETLNGPNAIKWKEAMSKE